MSTVSRRHFLRMSAWGAGSVLLAACAQAAPPAPRGPGTPVPATPVPATPAPVATAGATVAAAVTTLPGFEAFKERVQTYADDTYVYVESDGMPDHALMIGIRSWQQQVPLPQDYVKQNAWRIPRHAALAAQPVSARTGLYRGAIALAVNGVPIFNALNNRGDDAFLAGELDEHGGHAGRADDYHYHVAPLHLQAVVGPGRPIAYALDGFPLYGLTEPDGSAVRDLDEWNGHFDAAGAYHYHASTAYPYINGGLRGVVTVQGDQIEPQPRTTPVRPALEPLRGATVTDFAVVGAQAYALSYTLDGQVYKVLYEFQGTQYTFTFVDARGQTRTETYTRR